MDRTQLRQILATRFDASDLRMLCFELDMSYDDLAGRSKTEKEIELITYLEHRNRLPDLVEAGKRLRPDVDWGDAPTVPGPSQTTPSNAERDSLRGQLNRAGKILAALELRAAGYTTLTIPAHLSVELQEQQEKVARLRERLAALGG